ncbi:MAG TPA: peptidase M48 [Bacteroidales bacterium]|nr:peptidase M48 [Bacteroidales bacterium]
MMNKLFKVLVLAIGLSGCSDDSINFFTLEQDIQFGAQLDSAILAYPYEYPVLDRAKYAEAYTHIERVMNAILNSDDLRYTKIFPWQVRIIHDDEVLNAFAAPGGYLYFYTGLIKFLDNEAQLAGVMAHEIAHADRRHSTQMLTRQYGFSILLSIIMGDNPSQLEQILSQLALGGTMLKYSRDNEYEADKFAVTYLYDTDYHPRELAGFFEKMMSSTHKIPEFLSTHPLDENRVKNIEEVWKSMGSKVGNIYEDRYKNFKNALP